jgi:hypothetical protein
LRIKGLVVVVVVTVNEIKLKIMDHSAEFITGWIYIEVVITSLEFRC